MTRARSLLFLEIALAVAGLALALWCARILVEARRARTMPIEPVHVTMTLPGDVDEPTRAQAPKAGTVIGRLEAPSLELSTPVLEGSDDATLDRGAGHIEDTPFPGERGNIGIAGHRDTVFRPLQHAKKGDILVLRTADRVYRYAVTKTLIVRPEDVYVLDPTDDPTLTLVTCYPFRYIGHAPKRFVVQATLDKDTKVGAQ